MPPRMNRSCSGKIENFDVHVWPFQYTNSYCCSVAAMAQAAFVPVMATPVMSTPSGSETRDHLVPDRRRASAFGKLCPFGTPPTAHPPCAVAVTALRKPGIGAGRVTSLHALPFQCSSSVRRLVLTKPPVKPAAQASLALTTLIALSSPRPVSTLGRVSRDHAVPFQCSMSTFGDPLE